MGLQDFRRMCQQLRSGRGRVRQGVGACDRGVFGMRQIVVGQQSDCCDVWEFAQELSRRADGRVVGVQPGNQRHPDLDRHPRLRQSGQIRLDLFVAASGEFPVPGAVGVFEVVEKAVGPRQNPFEGAPGDLAAGVHRGVDRLLFQQLEQFGSEIGLEQRLAAGEGDSAAGNRVEHAVLQHRGHGFFLRQFPPVEFQRVEEAGVGAFPAGVATFAVEFVSAVRRDPVAGTDGGARSAAGASFPKESELRPGVDALRVVAPETVQRAPLEKQRGADSRAVMDGKVFDVANQRGRIFHFSASAWAMNVACNSGERSMKREFQPQTRI